jgi:hypothetical protein
MRAFHSDPAIKAKYMARVRAHREADTIVQGIGWEDGRGCAVGCTLDAYDHSRYPIELGVPLQLAYLEDRLHELQPLHDSLAWPERFLDTIQVGADLSRVWPQWAVWMLTDQTHGIILYAGDCDDVRAAILRVAELYSAPSLPADAGAEAAAAAADAGAAAAALAAGAATDAAADAALAAADAALAAAEAAWALAAGAATDAAADAAAAAALAAAKAAKAAWAEAAEAATEAAEAAAALAAGAATDAAADAALAAAAAALAAAKAAWAEAAAARAAGIAMWAEAGAGAWVNAACEKLIALLGSAS